MYRSASAKSFEHIVFPREEKRRQAINLAPPQYATVLEPEAVDVAWSDEEADFVAWLLAVTGVDARYYRTETLRRRLPACLRTVRATSPNQARTVLEAVPSMIPNAISSLLVGVTSFFRDPSVFEQLRVEMERFKAEGKAGLNVWSVGCSDGAELYSVAMSLAEVGMLQKSYLLGTDCRSEAIDQARKGVFAVSNLRQLPTTSLCKYLDTTDTTIRASEMLRQTVRWRVSNILAEIEPGLWDIILFRNTALYLRPDAVLPLWPKLESSLRPSGLLVLGRAERPGGNHRLRAVGPCLYRRHTR